MPLPVQAGELDSGSFIVFQNNNPEPVCWVHSDKTNPTGFEHWWWRAGFFFPPAQPVGSQVTWRFKRDVYGVEDWDQWQLDHGPGAPDPAMRTTVWKVHETRDEVP